MTEQEGAATDRLKDMRDDSDEIPDYRKPEPKLERFPMIGMISDSDTDLVPIVIDADKLKRLRPQEVSKVIGRGRLPEDWVEELEEYVRDIGGYEMRGYSHVELEMTQKRLSDTSGGYPATGYLKVHAVLASRVHAVDTESA